MIFNTSTNPSYDIAVYAANVADDRKAKDILILNTEQVSTLADYFVIATVESRTQMRALADTILKAMKTKNTEPIGQDVDKAGRWTLLDFGDIVIHLLHQEDRAFYNLERFWSHATEIPKSQWLETARKAS